MTCALAHGQLVVDPVQRRPRRSERQLPVGRLDVGAHAPERDRDALHRAGRERLVADELEAPAAPGPRGSPRGAARACPRSRSRSGHPPPAGPEGRLRARARVSTSGSSTATPSAPHGRDRRLRVRRAPEARDSRLALADRAEQDGPVRDRLVPGDGDVPDQRGCRLDAHWLCVRPEIRVRGVSGRAQIPDGVRFAAAGSATHLSRLSCP